MEKGGDENNNWRAYDWRADDLGRREVGRGLSESWSWPILKTFLFRFLSGLECNLKQIFALNLRLRRRGFFL